MATDNKKKKIYRNAKGGPRTTTVARTAPAASTAKPAPNDSARQRFFAAGGGSKVVAGGRGPRRVSAPRPAAAGTASGFNNPQNAARVAGMRQARDTNRAREHGEEMSRQKNLRTINRMGHKNALAQNRQMHGFDQALERAKSSNTMAENRQMHGFNLETNKTTARNQRQKEIFALGKEAYKAGDAATAQRAYNADGTFPLDLGGRAAPQPAESQDLITIKGADKEEYIYDPNTDKVVASTTEIAADEAAAQDEPLPEEASVDEVKAQEADDRILMEQAYKRVGEKRVSSLKRAFEEAMASGDAETWLDQLAISDPDGHMALTFSYYNR